MLLFVSDYLFKVLDYIQDSF